MAGLRRNFRVNGSAYDLIHTRAAEAVLMGLGTMRDVITIFAAGALMMAYALVAPTIVEAVQRPVPSAQKAFVQRLVQVADEAPISVVSGPVMDGVSTAGSALPWFARY